MAAARDRVPPLAFLHAVMAIVAFRAFVARISIPSDVACAPSEPSDTFVADTVAAAGVAVPTGTLGFADSAVVSAGAQFAELPTPV